MGIAKAIGGGFPLGACLATTEAGKGMTAGTHGSTFGANPLAMAAGNAVLDVVLAPGFLERVRRSAILFRQRLAEIRDRHPTVVADIRGEGLLLGLVAVCPNGELVEALRAENLLAAAAGDNVVRMIPPLIVAEPEILDAVGRIDRAAARIEKAKTVLA
jgi:acetylornithine/N-succinyldiaminopimelate aminotransferase